MNEVERFIQDEVNRALQEIGDAERDDLHALSFFLGEAEARRPVPQVGYNTRDQTAFQTEAANPPGVADEFVEWVGSL